MSQRVTTKQMRAIYDNHETYLKEYSTIPLNILYHICFKTHNLHITLPRYFCYPPPPKMGDNVCFRDINDIVQITAIRNSDRN